MPLFPSEVLYVIFDGRYMTIAERDALIAETDSFIAQTQAAMNQISGMQGQINAIADRHNNRGPWVTGHAYVLDDTVGQEGIAYTCMVPHLSGVFADDLAAGKWAYFSPFFSAIDAGVIA